MGFGEIGNIWGNWGNLGNWGTWEIWEMGNWKFGIGDLRIGNFGIFDFWDLGLWELVSDSKSILSSRFELPIPQFPNSPFSQLPNRDSQKRCGVEMKNSRFFLHFEWGKISNREISPSL